MSKLTNGSIAIEVKDHGAELCSIICGGRQYLWGADPKYWKRHSPVLFPIVGSVWNGEYRSGGKTFAMGQHGLARDMDFTLVSQTDDEVWYELRSSTETLAKYPYNFILRIGYKIHGTSVDVMWQVENPSDREMAFQIGAHPAFYWPLLPTEAINSGVEAMDDILAKADRRRGSFKLDLADDVKAPQFTRGDVPVIVCDQIEDKGCVQPALTKICELEGDTLPLTTSTFGHDALIIRQPQVKGVTLCHGDGRPYLTLRSEAPLMGLWSPPGKNAPFVCIEPWYGRTDDVDYAGDFEHKPYVNHLAAHSTFVAKYEIEIHA